MKCYLNEITGYADAITTLFLSRRTWTREKEQYIRDLCDRYFHNHGTFKLNDYLNVDENGKVTLDPKWQEEYNFYPDEVADMIDFLDKLFKWGPTHITMLRYIDMSFTVEGLHRAGQDDWDAHAQRFNNRIIRNSTSRAEFGYELSEFYQGKIIQTDIAAKILGIDLPESFEYEGYKWIKAINGYIREDLKDDGQVKRGLYMLSIPSTFTFKCNVTEFAHVYKERNKNGGANPEVKQVCEELCDLIYDKCRYLNRFLFQNIKN